METYNDNAPDEREEEENDPAPGFWSDEGARRFNEMLDEGSAYAAAGARLSEDCEDFESEQGEYCGPELCDPDEETLPPGEMAMIFENEYVM